MNFLWQHTFAVAIVFSGTIYVFKVEDFSVGGLSCPYVALSEHAIVFCVYMSAYGMSLSTVAVNSSYRQTYV